MSPGPHPQRRLRIERVTGLKYSMGVPTTPVDASAWHRNVLPLRGVEQTT
jgi:hypothetical protein